MGLVVAFNSSSLTGHIFKNIDNHQTTGYVQALKTLTS